MNILAVNPGSSSLKLALLDPEDRELLAREVPLPENDSGGATLAAAIAGQPIDGVGLRFVHGGETFTTATVIDPGVEAALRDLTDLAPLHQPRSLAACKIIRRARPDVPVVACFDTAFHGSMLPAASTYALPAEWRERWHIRKYGFHGLSHAYASRRAAELIGRPAAELRTVTCHLGAGASLAAVSGGRSVDTTMGFTPLDGLVMATRSGSVDPGLLIWLQQHGGVSTADLSDHLEHRSGLAGLAGSGDMRDIIRRRQEGDGPATLAFDVYVHRLRSAIGAMAAAMGGLDALVFTGGVGENAPEIRAETVAGLGFLGLTIDPAANQAQGDRTISPPESRPILVIRAREDLEIAAQTRKAMGVEPSPASEIDR